MPSSHHTTASKEQSLYHHNSKYNNSNNINHSSDGEEYTDEEEEDEEIDYTSSESYIEDVESQQVLRNRFMNKFEQRKSLKHKDDFFLILDDHHSDSNKKMDLDAFIQQADKVKCLKTYTPYCIVIHSVSNVVIPIEELNKYGGESSITVDYRLSATLYHTQTKCFVSRTFKGPITGRHFVKQVKKDQNRIQETIEFEIPLFFYSNIVDEFVVMVLELVAVLKHKTHIVHEFGAGWTILRIFKETKYGKTIEHLPKLLDYVNDDNFNVSREGSLYEGTPRALLQIQEPLEDQLNKKLGTRIFFSIFRHPLLKSSGAWSFFRSNDIISQKDFIPGIKFNYNKRQCDLVKPILSESVQLRLNGISIKLPKEFEQKLLNYMKEQRRKEHGEFLNPEKEVLISKRIVSIGSHNTFTYFQGPSESTLVPVKDQESGELSTLVLDNNFTLNFLPLDLCGILFEIQYVFEIPLPLGEFKRSFMDKLIGSNKNKKTIPEIDFTNYSVIVGNFAFFPSAAKSATFIEEELNTSSGLSFSGKPIFKLPNTISEKLSDHQFLIKFNFEIGNTIIEKIEKSKKQQPFTTTTTTIDEEIVKNDEQSPPPSTKSIPTSTTTFNQVVDSIQQEQQQQPNSTTNQLLYKDDSEQPPPDQTEDQHELMHKDEGTIEQADSEQQQEFEEESPPPLDQQQSDEEESPKTPRKEYTDYVLEQLSTPGSDLDGISVPTINNHHLHKDEMIELGRSRDLTREVKNHMNSLKFNQANEYIQSGSTSSRNDLESARQQQLESHNLYINFLSFSPKPNTNFPSSIYFRFKLFTFSYTDTSKTPLFLIEPTSFEENELYILSLKESFNNSTGGGVGVVGNGNGTSSSSSGNYGLQLKFTLDPSTVTEEEYQNFLSYIEHDSLFIDIFNAESKFKFGVIRVPMNLFIRNSEMSSTILQTKEYDIVEAMEGLIKDEGFTSDEGIKGKHLGKLYLSVCNVGKVAEFQQNKFVKAKQKYEQSTKKKIMEGNGGPIQSLYEQYNFLTSLKEPTIKELELFTNEELRYFCKQKMMSVVEYRKKEKSNVILHQIEDIMTSFRVIYASFGELSFFEIVFKNMYSKDHAFTIEIEQSKSLNLSVVHSNEERMKLSTHHQEWNCMQIENQGNLLYRFAMKSNSQQLRIPFKYQTFTELYEDSNVEEIKVFIRNSNGSILHVCKIRIVPRNFNYSQNLEFNHPVDNLNSRVSFKKKLRYSLQDFGHRYNATLSNSILVKTTGNIYASTSSYSNNSSYTSIELKTTLVHTSSSSGYILIYGDEHFHKLIEIWKVRVHPIETFNFDALIGQTNYAEYLIPKIDNNTSNIYVRFDSKVSDEINCEMNGEELRVEYTPQLNSEIGTFYTQFHILDGGSGGISGGIGGGGEGIQTRILAKYFLKINVQQQSKSKTYNHVIPINSTEKLKLSFVNTEQRTQVYTITTNHPELLGLKIEEVTLQPSQRHVIYMKFFPCFTIGSAEILLYINRKEDNQTVKCLGINVKYQ